MEISQENRSVASITYQNLFLLFPKMSGMSGTISDAAEELLNVYGSQVIVIPPNCTVKRQDLPDIYFKDVESQISAAILTAIETHRTGRPVLIVVTTIGESELVSKLLIEEKIPHNVLIANNAFWEADMIKEAGQMNAVTVATAMAGRGTDIRLGEGVKELGGLAVIGIGRMANIRQERQARGRAGRQGDPGFSRFFVSIQDEIVRSSSSVNVNKYIEGRRHIGKRKLKKIINTAQKTGEEFAVLSRKQAMDYDQVLQRQRELIYATRNQLLDGEVVENEKIIEIAEANIRHFLDSGKKRDMSSVTRYILDNISYRLDDAFLHISLTDNNAVMEYLLERVQAGLKEQEQKLGSRELMNDFMREATLRAIDDAWVEQVDYLQQLQSAVTGRASAQRNLVFEYQQDALECFQEMETTVLKNIVRNILLSNVYVDKEEKLRILLP